MSVQAAGATQPTTQQSPTDNGAGKLAQTYDDFLKLLTTQMKNQDPLDPTDSTEFTNQLVQFSQVEQAISSNTKLDALLSLTNSGQTMGMVSYVGVNIEYAGSNFSYSEKPVTMHYDVPANMKSASIVVRDESGKIIASYDAKATEGKQTFTWDGKDNNGKKMAAGNYSFQVTGSDKDGKQVSITTSIEGKVNAIESVNGVLSLMVGKTPVALGEIVAVRESAPAKTNDKTA